MGRPRKNRVSEYGALLADEILRQIGLAVSRGLAEQQQLYLAEVARLRTEIRTLGRQLEQLAKKRPAEGRARVGRWVPGGPGRPPKDAPARIAAFEARRHDKARRRRPRR